MVVDDIGAGTARRMAGRVAPEGKVLAVNVQPEMLRMLERLAQQQGVGRIEPTLATERDVMLAAGSVDVAVMVDVHHELAYPMAVLASVVLAPGSRLIPRWTRLALAQTGRFDIVMGLAARRPARSHWRSRTGS